MSAIMNLERKVVNIPGATRRARSRAPSLRGLHVRSERNRHTILPREVPQDHTDRGSSIPRGLRYNRVTSREQPWQPYLYLRLSIQGSR